MKLFRKRIKGNNKGLSLVELVCAVAIFGIVLTAIGSAMVVSAQSYANGTYEIDVQQEAQTTTNLIGNLIVDAVTAELAPSGDGKVLTVNNGKFKYVITYDGAGLLNYYEENLSTGATANGVLAQNVTDFDVDLTDFDEFNNAEVYLKVEKSDRAYEATYNTTSRNGSSESTGVADAASIIVENNVVLEPGQSYSFPITVVGSTSNKALSVSGLSAVTGDLADTTFSFNSTTGVATVTIGVNATGSFAFNVATIMTGEDGLPLASEQVVIKVRRVNAISSTSDLNNDGYADASALQSGTDCMADATYRIEFTPVGENFAKVFGKSFDMDYIDPRQVNLSVSMNSGYNVADYVEEVSKVYTATDSSNAYAIIKLKQDLPQGAEVYVTGSSMHAAGTNKTARAYATVTKKVTIANPFSPFSLSADINRGNDGHGIEILFDEDYHRQLVALYGSNYRRTITAYEAKLENGVYVIDQFAFGDVGATEEGGLHCQIRTEDSKRLRPDKAYIIECKMEFFDASGNLVWPTAGTNPDLYRKEFPIPALSVVYDCGTMSGTPGSEYVMTMNNGMAEAYIDFTCIGMDLNKYDGFVWEVEVSDGNGNYDPYTGSVETGVMKISNNESMKGHGQMKLILRETGTYRLEIKANAYPYKKYDGSTDTKTFNITNGEDSVLYVKVQ